MKRRAILLALVLALLLTGVAQAMSSANYAITWIIPLTSGGGGEASSVNYQASYSIGQSVVGASSSASYATNLGFWQLFFRYLKLPLIVK